MTGKFKAPRGSRGDAKYILRMPSPLRARIKYAADRAGQSMNTAILLALAEAFPEPVVPESINDALLQASLDVADQWEKLLTALGQDPSDNPALSHLRQRIGAANALQAEGDP